MIAETEWDDDLSEERPPLEDGMPLDAEEFHRRYWFYPDLKKAELIGGIVRMPTPVTERHGVASLGLVGWAGYYAAYTPGAIGLLGASNRLDSQNEVQPDLQVYMTAPGVNLLEAGWGEDILRAPTDLVGEVSTGDRERDWTAKYRLYEAAGFSEYIIWQADERVFEWFRLAGGRYHRLKPDSDGIHRSVAFPGLWLDSLALMRGDWKSVIAVVEQGIASPEHAAFVESLKPKPE